MGWGPLKLPLRRGAKLGVQIFQRTEEACEGVLEVGGTAAHLSEVAVTELVGRRYDRGAHRAIFVSTLRPGEAGARIDPECEAHRRPHYMKRSLTFSNRPFSCGSL